MDTEKLQALQQLLKMMGLKMELNTVRDYLTALSAVADDETATEIRRLVERLNHSHHRWVPAEMKTEENDES